MIQKIMKLKFDIALISLDAEHGLALTNRNFYYDNFWTLISIYYDGDSQIADKFTFTISSRTL